MADPKRASAPRIPFFLLFLFLLAAAIIGGLVSRLLPIGPTTGEATAPRALAGPADDSLAPLVARTAPAIHPARGVKKSLPRK